MPIDTRFLKQAKDQAGAMKRSGVKFVKANPVTATSAAAAMLLAPLLLQNDNRDYRQTAAFTSPLIAAGALAVTQMAPRAGQAADNLYGTHNAQREYRQTINATEVTYSDIKNAQKAYEDQKIALTMFQNMKRRFYAGRRRGKGVTTREAESLTRMVEENLTSESNLRYLSNSIHAERLRTGSAKELADYGKSFLKAEDAAAGFSGTIPKTAPILTAGEIREIVAGKVKLGNSSFIRGLSSRIHRQKDLIDPSAINPGMPALPGFAQKTPSRYNADIPWAGADGLQSRIMRERPDLYASINRSIQSGNVSVHNIGIKTTADGNITGFNYKIEGKRKGMWISYVGENGRIETGGSTFGRTGVARRIDTLESSMRSDTYAFEALGRGFTPRQVKEELKRANMFGLVDSSTDMATYLDPEYGEYVMTNGAQRLRQYQHIPSNLFGFDGENGQVGFRDLRKIQKNGPSRQVAAIQALAEKHNLTKVASEAGAYQGVLEEKHLEGLSLNPSREKQNSVWRAETKGVRMGRSPHTHNPDTWSTVRDRLDPFFETNKLELEGVQDHGVSVRSAGVTPGQQTLFGDMPDVTDVAEAQIEMELKQAGKTTAAEQSAIRVRAYAESFAAEGRYDVHAMSILQAENKLTHAESKAAWNQIVTYLSNPGNTRIMKKAGRVGEGEFLTEPGLYGANVERYVRYDVHESLIHDWDQHVGTSIEERFGAKKGQSVMIGRSNGNPVTAGGTENFIENMFDMGEGKTGILVRETRPIGTGTKFDKGSLKGNNHAFSSRGDAAIFREGLNVHSKAVGVNAVIPNEVNMFVSQVYDTNKGSETQDSLASMVGDSLRRAQEQKQLDPLLAKWKDPMHQLGFDYNPELGKLTFDVGNEFTQAMTLEERVKQHTSLLQNMMNDVGARITQHQLDGDAFMRSYADLGGKGGSWTDYVHRNANPSTLRITDDMGWNAAQEVKLAYYTRQQLVGRGQHAIAAELLDRLNYDGDPGITKQLQNYMNGDRTAITQQMSMKDAMDGRSLRNLSAESRANTVFDPGFAAADNNFLMTMPDGSKVPVLGHEGYGGKVNRFGTGEFSASEHEKELFNLVKMHEKGTHTPAALATQQAEYEKSLKQYLHGKNSLYRADAVDPLAQEFRPMTRPSGLRYEDGSINPFEVGIGREKAAAIKDKRVRDALFNGEDVFMMGTREPVSHTPLYKVTIDDALNGSNIIGMDEGQRALLMADGDGDRVAAHFLKPGGEGQDALINHAHAEAADAVFNQESIQAHSVKFQQSMTGVGDETRKLVGTAGGDYKSFVGRLKNQKMYTMSDALKRRSTAGSIGSGSNIHSLFMTALEENTNITDAFVKDDLSTFFFQAIKQGPISAAKMKAGGEMDLAKALGINKTLRDSMREGGTFDQFYAGMNQLSQWADGADSTAFHDYLSENREMFRAYHSGFDRNQVNAAVDALTTPADQAFTAKSLGMSDNVFSYAQAASTSTEEARAAGAAGATASAETIGMMNKTVKEAKAVGREMSKGKIGLILGMGVAAAAIAGIASTQLESPDAVFGRDSSNGYRPEEKNPGHEIPGEGPAGSRAPSRPRRNVVPAPATTHTAIVAPLGETRDLDVKLRARDRQRASRTARMMSQMSTDGDSSVTVNYRDQMKPGSFRTQERMREAMG